MTYQRDPDGRRRYDLRREDGSYSMMPVALAVVFALLLGFILYSSMSGDRTDTPAVTTERTDRPAMPPASKTTPPATTPAPPATPAPKQP